MRYWRRAIDLINGGVCWLAVAIGALLVLLTATQVFYRYVLNKSILFSDEASRFFLIWISYLGAALAMHEGAHVGMEFAIKRFPAKIRRAGLIVGASIILLYLIALFHGSLLAIRFQWTQYATTLPIRLFWSYLAIPVGLLLMANRIGFSLVCLVRGEAEELRPLADLMGYARNLEEAR